MKTGHWLALGLAGVLLVVLGKAAFSVSENADLPVPGYQPPADSDLARWKSHNPDGHPGYVCGPEDHHGGYVFLPHRFPRTTGGEITNAIHRGFSSMRIPGGAQDVQWMIAPPSEVMW